MSVAGSMNQFGLTFRRWLAAAGLKSSPKLRKAWMAGNDPADWRPKFKRAVRKVRKAIGV